MNDLEVITFDPTTAVGTPRSDRVGHKWIAENATDLEGRKVMLEGGGQMFGRYIHFALIRGLSKEEVKQMHAQQKAEQPEGTGFYWLYLATDDALRIPSVLNDCTSGGPDEQLENVLQHLGGSRFFRDLIGLEPEDDQDDEDLASTAG